VATQAVARVGAVARLEAVARVGAVARQAYLAAAEAAAPRTAGRGAITASLPTWRDILASIASRGCPPEFRPRPGGE